MLTLLRRQDDIVPFGLPLCCWSWGFNEGIRLQPVLRLPLYDRRHSESCATADLGSLGSRFTNPLVYPKYPLLKTIRAVVNGTWGGGGSW